MATTFEIRGVKELQAAIRRAPRVAQGELRGATTRSLRMLKADVQAQVPVDRGGARRGIRTSTRASRRGIEGELYGTAFQLRFLISGTGTPAGNRRHWPNPEKASLVDWARRHGAEARDIAYFIAKRGGLRPRVALGTILEASLGRIGAEFSRALDQVARDWGR